VTWAVGSGQAETASGSREGHTSYYSIFRIGPVEIHL